VVDEADTAARWLDPSDAGANTAAARVALEFKSKSTVRDLRTSLFRVQLSGTSALHFRPRGGGLNVAYRESF
jgi:hypothetical protein